MEDVRLCIDAPSEERLSEAENTETPKGKPGPSKPSACGGFSSKRLNSRSDKFAAMDCVGVIAWRLFQ